MRRLLVALDASPRAPGVLSAAAGLARAAGAELVIFRAVGIPAELPRPAYAVSPEELERLLLRQAEAELAEVARPLPPELPRRLLAELGVPWRAICEAARREDADLIVLGAHGYSRVDQLLGTTAARVTNAADRAVLIVRAPERLSPRTP